MKAMESLQDLIEEAKVRTVWWALCIFAISYFLTHTSKSMWMNIPLSILLVSGLRILFNEVEFHWKIQKARRQTYLSHLEKKQLSVNDSRLSALALPPKWKRKIDSPVVEAAIEDFVNKILQDFVVDLWYSDITPDKEAPELMRAIFLDVLGEVSARVKDINLFDLLTRDVVDLIGDHLELFRRNQIAIGVEVMGTLSSEERDERLKHHLVCSKELHPALTSPDCEYKVLQRLMGGVLATILRPREAQCPLVRCIARELLTCLVIQPVMNFASPGYVNELIEYIFLTTNKEGMKVAGDELSHNVEHGHAVATDSTQNFDFTSEKTGSSHSQRSELTLSRPDHQRELSGDVSGKNVRSPIQDETMHSKPADWARILEAATQRRTEVLMPENLENMWTKGRNYKKKIPKYSAAGLKDPIGKNSGLNSAMSASSTSLENKTSEEIPPASVLASGTKSRLKRSNSTSDLEVQTPMETKVAKEVTGPIISEFYSADVYRHNEVRDAKNASDTVLRVEGYVPKLRCRVLGAYFEKLGSKSFAVYSITVTDAGKNTWFVKRRYSNFERLHRHLKDIPNYTLHLPPKRIFSSSTEDTFVHQRCIQLDKYLQDLLSIANVAEQHEVWDFLSVSSINYSFGKSSSVMRTLAVNVDDAVDDIVRQFKGVSGGLMRKVVSPPSSAYGSDTSVQGRNLSWKSDEINILVSRQNTAESANSFSDNDEDDKDGNRDQGHDRNQDHEHDETDLTAQATGWHSDNELNAKGFPPRVVKLDEVLRSLHSEKNSSSGVRSELLGLAANYPTTSDILEDPLGVPPEWTPPNFSVPVLNLVDNIFQLKRRGWLRRQVFWISKQILQLMMEDAIDDWLLRQIHWLRRDDVVAQGIRWIQDVLWPDGKFFLKSNAQSQMDDCQTNQSSSQATNAAKLGSFEQQLEAARRASDVKKMIFNGAPTTLVSLIGNNQYKRCAKDIYFFLQSTVCLKQLGYGILELLLMTVFPELRDVVVDIHERVWPQSV